MVAIGGAIGLPPLRLSSRSLARRPSFASPNLHSRLGRTALLRFAGGVNGPITSVDQFSHRIDLTLLDEARNGRELQNRT